MGGGERRKKGRGSGGLRVLVDKGRGIVDFVVHDDVEVLLAAVGGDVGVGELRCCSWGCGSGGGGFGHGGGCGGSDAMAAVM